LDRALLGDTATAYAHTMALAPPLRVHEVMAEIDELDRWETHGDVLWAPIGTWPGGSLQQRLLGCTSPLGLRAMLERAPRLQLAPSSKPRKDGPRRQGWVNLTTALAGSPDVLAALAAGRPIPADARWARRTPSGQMFVGTVAGDVPDIFP